MGVNALTTLTKPNSFTFTLSSDSNCTSAGVYNSSGQLLRTLWSNRKYKAESYTCFWDGFDDDGNFQTYGTVYTVKVSSNNIAYTWEGVVGNTSDNNTGSTVWHYLKPIIAMCEVGNYMYFSSQYGEGSCAQGKFLKTTPNQKITHLANTGAGQQSFFICANGTNVFYGGTNSNAGYQGAPFDNFIFGTAVSNDAEITFSAGVALTNTPRSYASVIDLATTTANAITGMAVQQSGSQFLFASHGAANNIKVYKTSDGSGTLAQTIVITGVTNLFLENDTTLWLAQNGTALLKYTVNSDGTITSAGVQISGFTAIAGISIHSGDLCVYDNGNQQVVKRYNSSSLASTGTVGTAGGYATSPAVTNTKFYTNDLTGALNTFVAHQSDGSIWIGDTGNWRLQHFDSSGTYLNNIMFCPSFYSTIVCLNQNTSVFAELIEFTIDYSQPLATGWTLTNNWGYSFPAGYDRSQMLKNGIVLMSNGRRYGIVRNINNYYFAELTATGLRVITANLLPAMPIVDAAGGLTSIYSTPQVDSVLTFNEYILTGFDGSNNPTYSAAVATHVTIPANYPVPGDSRWLLTTSGELVLYNGNTNSIGTKAYHLAGYNIANSAFNWKTAKDTFKAYTGDFPMDGAWDQGNLVGYSGSNAACEGNNVFYDYHGEFWRGSETGWLYHFNDIGLLQGMFGALGFMALFKLPEAPVAFAGNGINIATTTYNGDIYLYVNDESTHGGLHRFRISNLASQSVQSISLTLANRAAPAINRNTRVDLLAGLPDNQASIHGVSSIWSTFPGTEYNNGYGDFFYTSTRLNTYDYTKSPDLSILTAARSATPVTYGLKGILTSLRNLTNWCISGQLQLDKATILASQIVFITLTDINNKVLAKLSLNYYNFGFNGVTLGTISYGYGTNDFVIKKSGSQIYLLINMYGTWFSSTQSIFDNTADITNISFINFNYTLSSQGYGINYGINQLFFDGY